MKIIKKIFVALLVLIVLLVGISFMLPKTIDMEQSIVINGPAAAAFELVNTPKKWSEWSAWDQIDPEMQSFYSGPESGVGARHNWESEHSSVGNGSLLITESEPNKHIRIEFYFMEHDTAVGTYHFEETDEGVKVTSGFHAEMPPVFGPYMRLIMIREIEKNTAKSLEAIKHIMESMPEANREGAIEVVVSKVESRPMFSIVDSANMVDISAKLGELYGEIQAHMEQMGAEQISPPLAIWHEWDPEAQKAVLEAGIPVNDAAEGTGRIKAGASPSGRMCRASHFGDYGESEATYNAIEAYIKDRDLTQAGPPWEVYITDPTTQPDTSKWETKIYFPVAE